MCAAHGGPGRPCCVVRRTANMSAEAKDSGRARGVGAEAQGNKVRAGSKNRQHLWQQLSR